MILYHRSGIVTGNAMRAGRRAIESVAPKDGIYADWGTSQYSQM